MPTAVPVNYAAVVVCALASMVIGSLWYGPLFGKQWMALSGFTEEKMKAAKAKGQKGMAKLYAIQALGSLVMAFVLAHALVFASAYMKISGVSAGLQVGLWNWLGFVAPITLSMVLWDGKPWKLWLINNSNHLVTLCTMGVILSLWK